MAESGWQWLLPELLEEIAGRLVTEADHVHVHQVCAHWRASTALPSATRRPWLVAVIRPWRRMSPVGAYSVWHLDGVGHVDLRGASPPAGVPRCCGMPRGWLALTDDDELPTRAAGALGSHLRSGGRAPAAVFLSGDPLSSPPPQQWMALASQQNVPRADSQKTGRVVVPHDAAEAELLHLQDRERRLPRREADLRRLAAAPRRLRPQLHRRRDDAAGAAGVQVQWLPSFAEVYKPPAAEWTAPAERWQLEFGEKVTDLGGYSVFLGRGEGFAVHAQDFPLIRGNCVYYARNDILYSLMSCREFHVLRNIMRGKELAAAGPILGCVSRGPSSLPQGVVSSDEDYFLNNSIASTKKGKLSFTNFSPLR
uniref:KIB1-4 beta-propeller domain-containing protein n=1 Tax=Oryza nivara TaxID=4536 RepID=A0A0E0IV41_ORYNI